MAPGHRDAPTSRSRRRHRRRGDDRSSDHHRGPPARRGGCADDGRARRGPPSGVENGPLVGIVSRADIVRLFTRSDEEIPREIRTTSPGRMFGSRPTIWSSGSRAGEVLLGGSRHGGGCGASREARCARSGRCRRPIGALMVDRPRGPARGGGREGRGGEGWGRRGGEGGGVEGGGGGRGGGGEEAGGAEGRGSRVDPSAVPPGRLDACGTFREPAGVAQATRQARRQRSAFASPTPAAGTRARPAAIASSTAPSCTVPTGSLRAGTYTSAATIAAEARTATTRSRPTARARRGGLRAAREHEGELGQRHGRERGGLPRPSRDLPGDEERREPNEPDERPGDAEPEHHFAGEEVPRAQGGRACPRGRGIARERERGKAVGEHVDGQDLHVGDRRNEPGGDRDREQHHLAEVRREQERDDLAHVVADPGPSRIAPRSSRTRRPRGPCLPPPAPPRRRRDPSRRRRPRAWSAGASLTPSPVTSTTSPWPARARRSRACRRASRERRRSPAPSRPSAIASAVAT